MKNRKLFIIINFLYLAIPLLILFFPILFRYKFYILVLFGIIIYFLIKANNISNDEIGITKNNIFKSFINNLPIISVSIFIIILMRILNLNKFTPNENIYFYLFYIFISCPIQEFLYRGVYGYFDNGKNNILFLSSFMYSFVHIIYRDLLTNVLTFIIGLIWFSLYRRDKNLLGTSVSHCVLGILTILLGIVD
jgi:abortive infection protein